MKAESLADSFDSPKVDFHSRQFIKLQSEDDDADPSRDYHLFPAWIVTGDKSDALTTGLYQFHAKQSAIGATRGIATST